MHITRGCDGFDGRARDSGYNPEPEFFDRRYTEDAWAGADSPYDDRFDGDEDSFFPDFAERFDEERPPGRFENDRFFEFPEEFGQERRGFDRDRDRDPRPGDMEQLREFMDGELESIMGFRRLACRLPRFAKTLLGMEADERRHLKKLRARYYLLTCCRYSPCSPEKCCESTCDMLRGQYAHELAEEKAYLAAAERTQNADLSELYREIAPEENLHAKRLARIVEAFLGETTCSCRD